MNLPYQQISDSKYDFLPEENDFRASMKFSIAKAGRKKVIFVEGYDDEVVFEIIYEDYLTKLSFIDVSLENAKRTSYPNVIAGGGCERVKFLLTEFIKNIKEKRFYGIIDRDLKTDQEIQIEITKACYDGRLFIFRERYTLENYFINLDVLKAFIHGQSAVHKKLIPLVNDEAKLENIIDSILSCLVDIAAANLTIRYFDKSVPFVEETITGDTDEIKERVYKKLEKCEDCVKDSMDRKFKSFTDFILQSEDNVQKFTSAKTYFAFQFNKCLHEGYGINLQINKHKSELARILKDYLPDEFKQILNFLEIT